MSLYISVFEITFFKQNNSDLHTRVENNILSKVHWKTAENNGKVNTIKVLERLLEK